MTKGGGLGDILLLKTSDKRNKKRNKIIPCGLGQPQISLRITISVSVSVSVRKAQTCVFKNQGSAQFIDHRGPGSTAAESYLGAPDIRIYSGTFMHKRTLILAIDM